METMNKTERLNEVYRELFGRGIVSNKKDFARQIEYDYANIVSALSGNRDTTDDMLSKVGYKWEFFNRDWLRTGIGSVTKDNNYYETNREQNNVTPVPENNYMMVELKDLETEAGRLWVGGDVNQLPEEKTRLVPREYGNGNYLVVRVSGHSMDDGTKRSICEDDELLIRQYIGDVRTMPYRTKLFVVCTMGGNVIKQVTQVDNITGEITCHSFNKQYDDYTIPVGDIIQIFTVEKKVKAKIIF